MLAGDAQRVPPGLEAESWLKAEVHSGAFR